MGRTGIVTIRDVARECGYSASTVSIVLNGAPLSRYIPADTKGRIETAAKRMGYRPNPLARSLRSQRSNIVGVMVIDITDPFCTPILRGLENALYQASYLSLLADAHNEPNRFERYLEMLLDRRVEGLVVIANWLVTDIKLLADLTECQVPTVIAGRSFENHSVSTVSVDNESGAPLWKRSLIRRNRASGCSKCRCTGAGSGPGTTGAGPGWGASAPRRHPTPRTRLRARRSEEREDGFMKPERFELALMKLGRALERLDDEVVRRREGPRGQAREPLGGHVAKDVGEELARQVDTGAGGKLVAAVRFEGVFRCDHRK